MHVSVFELQLVDGKSEGKNRPEQLQVADILQIVKCLPPFPLKKTRGTPIIHKQSTVKRD